MAEPILMFGVGAAKSGTSWLHRYLDEHPECHFRAIKELQYFNSADWGPEVWEKKIKRIEKIRDNLAAEAGDPNLSAKRMMNKVRQVADVEHFLEVMELRREDLNAYRDYVFHEAGDAKVVGELTPAYSLLSEDRLKSMAGLSGDVRFVYLMRDPVERLWSHVRMIAKERCKAPDEYAARASNVMSRTFRGEEDHIMDRSDYVGALMRLKNAIDPRKLFIGFYEELFSSSGVRKVCDFLGLTYQEPQIDKRVHSGIPLQMNSEQRAQALEFLAPQYRAISEMFGRLPSGWTNHEMRVA